MLLDIIDELDTAINASDTETALNFVQQLRDELQVSWPAFTDLDFQFVIGGKLNLKSESQICLQVQINPQNPHTFQTRLLTIIFLNPAFTASENWELSEVRSGLMQRAGNVGGIAYRPEFLLDCILLCDNLREPSTMRDTISRTRVWMWNCSDLFSFCFVSRRHVF